MGAVSVACSFRGVTLERAKYSVRLNTSKPEGCARGAEPRVSTILRILVKMNTYSRLRTEFASQEFLTLLFAAESVQGKPEVEIRIRVQQIPEYTLTPNPQEK